MRECRLEHAIQRRERPRVARKGVCVEQADVELVEGIGGEWITIVEMRRDGRGEARDESPNFLPRRLVPSDGVRTRQT